MMGVEALSSGLKMPNITLDGSSLGFSGRSRQPQLRNQTLRADDVRFSGGSSNHSRIRGLLALIPFVALGLGTLLLGPRDSSSLPESTKPRHSAPIPPTPLSGLRPLALDMGELNRTANAMAFNEYDGTPLPEQVSLSQAQASYRKIVDPWTYRLLNTLYQAEREGKVYQAKSDFDPATITPDPALKPGIVYRYLAGFTRPGEEVPDQGHPGTFRVAKRMLIDGHQMDVCEAWEVHPKGKGVETRLVDIRTHFTSNLPLVQRTNIIVFNRFGVEGNGALIRANEFLPDNTLAPETRHDPIRGTPGQCLACHIGLVGHERTFRAAKHHFPEQAKTEDGLEALVKPAFHLDTFLPNSVYFTPPADQLGLQEWLKKAPGATPELAQKLTTPQAFVVPEAVLNTLKKRDRTP